MTKILKYLYKLKDPNLYIFYRWRVFQVLTNQQKKSAPGVVAHVFNPSTKQSGLHSKFQATLSYVERPCFRERERDKGVKAENSKVWFGDLISK